MYLIAHVVLVTVVYRKNKYSMFMFKNEAHYPRIRLYYYTALNESISLDLLLEMYKFQKCYS